MAGAARWLAGHSGRPAVGSHPGVLVVLRWCAILAGTVAVQRVTGSPAAVISGVPVAVIACLRTAEGYVTVLRPGWITTTSLLAEAGVATAVVAATGGWHSGWVITLAVEAGIAGFSVPVRVAGQVASAFVIVMFLANLATRNLISAADRTSLDLDGLLLVAALAVSYATWLARFGDVDRARLARTNQRLMATNDLLVMLQRAMSHGEEATDPQQAARTVAGICRKVLSPEVVVVASASEVADGWRILLAEGVTIGAIVDDLPVLERVRADIATGDLRPARATSAGELLSPDSGDGACIPLTVRGRLIGAVVLESGAGRRWADADFDLMSEISGWAALLVDNACRFNALWVVGSAEERARVARNLHDSLGQSMAALGLQLDWIARTVDDPDHSALLRELRTDVTAMVAELRFTMRDLCCDVSAERSLADALGQLVQGLGSRARREIRLDVVGERRLPVAQEHQILQMARTLLTAAVESRAPSVEVSWRTGPDEACLEIGYKGAPADAAAPGGRYESEPPISLAMAEVRDRCWAVGATMEYDMEYDECRVRCRIAA